MTQAERKRQAELMRKARYIIKDTLRFDGYLIKSLTKRQHTEAARKLVATGVLDEVDNDRSPDL